MKIKHILSFFALLCAFSAGAQERIFDELKETPYPQEGNGIYINPAPLIVPVEMKTADYLQFAISRDKKFKDATTMVSKPVEWYVFNPHKQLENGRWYWRFRSVDKDGKASKWSRTYSFVMTADVPVFVTPPYEVFAGNIPEGHNRIYPFLDKHIDEARKVMRDDPEFEAMIWDSRVALAHDYRNDSLPYRHISQMYIQNNDLFTAYKMLQRDIYADKMAENVRCLLRHEPDPKVISDDFKSGELMYTLANAYEVCYDRFTPAERERLLDVLEQTFIKYAPHTIGFEDVHIFNNHFWQFLFRYYLQAALVLRERCGFARTYIEYSYENWTCRAPTTGFNRDGNWYNGPCYFSANAISLFYIPTLFSWYTGTDFFEHPWYRNAGIGVAYTWQPESMSDGFGDGHEQMNPKPRRIRSAFADYMARITGDPYAAWYSTVDKRYMQDSETRIFRLAMNMPKPEMPQLPADAPKAVWFKDSGEMIANSDLNDYRNNLCLAFRSSPFGSGSHTHSDQNSFNLLYRGVPVYRAVGHYMNYSDRHNLLDYRHTRGHNSILINGIGQPYTSRAWGNIVRMLGGDNISYALGDASHAYCGISEYPMWEDKMAASGVKQSVENGFGETPLTKFRRHIFMLHPNKVLIYDELEASEPAVWDWLLHSPVKFNVQGNRLGTVNEERNFNSVAKIFSDSDFSISQKNEYYTPVNTKGAQRGEDFSIPWSLTARFDKTPATRVLVLIQVQDGKMEAEKVARDGNVFRFGDWTVEAEMDASKEAALTISNAAKDVRFSYSENEASRLHDSVGGEVRDLEMTDRPPLTTSNPQ